MPAVSVIIVNWNTAGYLRKCLSSIRENTRDVSYEIIVVDNSSFDGSVEMIKKDFPRVCLVSPGKNLGFARGNNAGIDIAEGRYVFILNPDTELMNNAIKVLSDFLDKNNDAVGMTCKLIDGNGNYQPSFFPFPKVFSKWLFYSFVMLIPGRFLLPRFRGNLDEVHKVDWGVGAALMVRRDALKAIGGFDNNIFMFSEDSDLCLRLQKSTGKGIFYNPEAVICHFGGVTYEGGDIRVSRSAFISTSYFFHKNHGEASARIFRDATRFIWYITMIPLGVAVIATLGKYKPFKRKLRMYADMITTKVPLGKGSINQQAKGS